MSEAVFPVVTDEEFPYGLRCTRCSRVIEAGQPYSSVLDEVGPTEDDGDSDIVSFLVCVYCSP